MAGEGGKTTTAAPKPLRLKDLLELDCDSCSAAGFRCYPRRLLGDSSAPVTTTTMRHLLEPRRRPGKLSHLSRSLSRRLGRGGFWRRRDGDEDEDDDAAAAVPGGSGSDQSAASSLSSETTSDDSSSGRTPSRCGSDSDFSTASSASDIIHAAAAAAVAGNAGHDHEAMKRGRSSSGSEADDKEEQLSPVAVMDFPFDDEDGDADRESDAGACSPSFSLARLQRRKMLRQHKNRRFGSTEELGAVDLEARLAATSDHDDLAHDAPAQKVIQRRAEDAAAPRTSSGAGGVVGNETDGQGPQLLMDAGVDHVSERLLLDFFVEMRGRRGSAGHSEELSASAGLLPRKDLWLGDGEVLAEARGWLDGAGSERRWGLDDVLRGGEAVLAEMERGRRWTQVGEEEREVGTVVARMLADQLLDEVVWDCSCSLYHWTWTLDVTIYVSNVEWNRACFANSELA